MDQLLQVKEERVHQRVDLRLPLRPVEGLTEIPQTVDEILGCFQTRAFIPSHREVVNQRPGEGLVLDQIRNGEHTCDPSFTIHNWDDKIPADDVEQNCSE